jgi:hypothetical protein
VSPGGLAGVLQAMKRSMVLGYDNDNRQLCTEIAKVLPLWHGKLTKWMKLIKN